LNNRSLDVITKQLYQGRFKLECASLTDLGCESRTPLGKILPDLRNLENVVQTQSLYVLQRDRSSQPCVLIQRGDKPFTDTIVSGEGDFVDNVHVRKMADSCCPDGIEFPYRRYFENGGISDIVYDRSAAESPSSGIEMGRSSDYMLSRTSGSCILRRTEIHPLKFHRDV
jgi:hypothetical protein